MTVSDDGTSRAIRIRAYGGDPNCHAIVLLAHKALLAIRFNYSLARFEVHMWFSSVISYLRPVRIREPNDFRPICRLVHPWSNLSIAGTEVSLRCFKSFVKSSW